MFPDLNAHCACRPAVGHEATDVLSLAQPLGDGGSYVAHTAPSFWRHAAAPPLPEPESPVEEPLSLLPPEPPSVPGLLLPPPSVPLPSPPLELDELHAKRPKAKTHPYFRIAPVDAILEQPNVPKTRDVS